jgi:hypothetical protein
MHTPGCDDELLMSLPLLLFPVQIWIVYNIMRKTPFMVKETVRIYQKVKYLYFSLVKQICLEIHILSNFSDVDPMATMTITSKMDTRM